MKIITSIMCKGTKEELENQRRAVDTWLSYGFEVYSANIWQEIDEMGSLFPDVQFVELKRTAQPVYGKQIPYIYDMLNILLDAGEDGEEICGIINADILLRGFQIDQIEDIFSKNEKSLICLHRYDIDENKDLVGTYYFSGIDVFLLKRKFLSVFKDEGYALSKPEWDHWMVYSCIKQAIQIIEIKNAIAFHVRHKQRWTPFESNKIGMKQKTNCGKQDQGEEYYTATNYALSDLSNRIVLKTKDNVEAMVTDAPETIYIDKDIKEVAQYERKLLNKDVPIQFQMGIGYFKKDKFYRISALHSSLNKEYNCPIVYTKENQEKKPIAVGEIMAYLDAGKSSILTQLRQFYLYPGGRAARLMLDCLLEMGIEPIGFVDKDENMQRSAYRNIKVYAPDVLKNDNYDKVLLVSNLYVEEIYEELQKILPKEKIIVI